MTESLWKPINFTIFGPAAFYWMSDIAAQIALLSAAQINGIPTNANMELGASATAGDVVRLVVK